MTSPVLPLIAIGIGALGLLWAGWKRSRIVEPVEPEGDVPSVPRPMQRGGR